MIGREEFLEHLDIPGVSRVGRVLRCRAVVHSVTSNSTFKAYYAGSRWIAETWAPLAFLFASSASEIGAVTKELLSVPLWSQNTVEVARLQRGTRISSGEFVSAEKGANCFGAEKRFESIIRERRSIDDSIEVEFFRDGIQLSDGNETIVLVYLRSEANLSIEGQSLCYGTELAFQNQSFQNLLALAGLHLRIDE